MAIENAKELFVRLCNLKLTEAEWLEQNPVLEDGECAITTGSTEAAGTVLMLRVGDGSTAYKSLPFLSAPASDVYAWAKAKTKPAYTATEINQLTEYIEDALADDVNVVNAVKEIAQTLIGALDVGDTAAAGEYVSAVSQTDGKITVSRKAFSELAGTVFAPAAHIHNTTEITHGTTNTSLVTVIDNLQSSANNTASKVSTLIGDDTGKSARAIAAEELAKQLIPENAAEALDTLAEIAAWIQSHPNDATAMQSSIASLRVILSGFGTDSGAVKAYIDAAIEALKIGDYAKAADLTAVAARVTTLEGKAHTHANKAVLDGITAAKINAWDAKPDTDDLAAIAFSGTTDDLSQGAKTLVLRCKL